MTNTSTGSKKTFEGLSWRYNLYVRPHLLLHENIWSAVVRCYRNQTLKYGDEPTCYIYADAGNIGDRVSAMGVRLLAGKPGIELFASRAGLGTTIRMLKWLQKNRPKTRIIIGGGGLLQECFVPFWTELLKTSLPFALFGIGANEMPGKRELPPDDLLKQLAQRAVAIHVRDKWTGDLMQHGQEKQVSTGVCPAVNYLAARYQIHSGNNNYLLHVKHPVDVRMSGGNPEQISASLKSLAADINLQYDEADHIKEDLNSLVKRYRRSRFVVSSRLHGCIFSYAFGIPCVPIVSDKKTAAFVETHIPWSPVMSVRFTNNEILQELLAVEKQINKLNGVILDPALSNNESAMRNLIAGFAELPNR